MNSDTRFVLAEQLSPGDVFISTNRPTILYTVESVSVDGDVVEVQTDLGALSFHVQQDVLLVERIEKVPAEDLLDGTFEWTTDHYLILGVQFYRLQGLSRSEFTVRAGDLREITVDLLRFSSLRIFKSSR